MPRRHLIISGTGRAGTTFLVQLFTELRLDTGFADPWSGLFPNCDAGMETDIRRPDAPYIVKNPWLCDSLDEILTDGEIAIDHAIVPIRDLYSAAESRRDVTRRAAPVAAGGYVPGGLWHTADPDAQEAILAQQLYKLLHAIAKHDVPLTLLDFPRFLRDPEYLHRKIVAALPGLDRDAFLRAFQSVSRPQLVHDFRSSRTIDAPLAATPEIEHAANPIQRSEIENRTADRQAAEARWREEVERLHGEVAEREALIDAMRTTAVWRLRSTMRKWILGDDR